MCLASSCGVKREKRSKTEERGEIFAIAFCLLVIFSCRVARSIADWPMAGCGAYSILHGYVEQDDQCTCVDILECTDLLSCMCCGVYTIEIGVNSHGHSPKRSLCTGCTQTGSPSLLGGGGASGAALPSALPSTVPSTLSRAAAGTSAGSAQPLVHTDAGRAGRATLWEGGGGFAQPTVRAAARADLISRGGRPHQSLGRALCGQGRGARWSARSGWLTPLCQRRGGPPWTRPRQGGTGTAGEARPFAGHRVLGVGG